MPETVRTFIALDLSDEVRAFLAQREDRLRRAGGDVRWVRPDRMHLTLVFLGEVAVDRLGALEAAVRGACQGFGPLALRAGGAGQFPPRGRPRVLWSAMDEPTGTLVRLQKALAGATAAFAQEVEDRAYVPHLTLGRVRGGRDLERLGEAVAAMARDAGPALEAREVLVIKSRLSPEGPQYTVLARVPLAKA
jgi:2'-5' RNA ligase